MMPAIAWQWYIGYLDGYDAVCIIIGGVHRIFVRYLVVIHRIQTASEQVNLGPGKDYIYHSTVKKFLEEAALESLDLLAADKSILVDFCCSLGSSAHEPHRYIAATTCPNNSDYMVLGC